MFTKIGPESKISEAKGWCGFANTSGRKIVINDKLLTPGTNSRSGFLCIELFLE